MTGLGFFVELRAQGMSLEKTLCESSVKTTLDEYGTEDLEIIRENFSKVTQDMLQSR
ncbi:MAG: hypothetical protein V1857_04795 [archaeon]